MEPVGGETMASWRGVPSGAYEIRKPGMPALFVLWLSLSFPITYALPAQSTPTRLGVGTR